MNGVIKMWCVILMVLVFSLLTACSPGYQAEIVGVAALASLDDLADGEIDNLVYDGSLVVLLDGEEVEAICPEELLPDVAGCPTFDADQVSGGLVASISIALDEGQEARLVPNADDEWEVIEILD